MNGQTPTVLCKDESSVHKRGMKGGRERVGVGEMKR